MVLQLIVLSFLIVGSLGTENVVRSDESWEHHQYEIIPSTSTITSTITETYYTTETIYISEYRDGYLNSSSYENGDVEISTLIPITPSFPESVETTRGNYNDIPDDECDEETKIVDIPTTQLFGSNFPSSTVTSVPLVFSSSTELIEPILFPPLPIGFPYNSYELEKQLTSSAVFSIGRPLSEVPTENGLISGDEMVEYPQIPNQESTTDFIRYVSDIMARSSTISWQDESSETPTVLSPINGNTYTNTETKRRSGRKKSQTDRELWLITSESTDSPTTTHSKRRKSQTGERSDSHQFSSFIQIVTPTSTFHSVETKYANPDSYVGGFKKYTEVITNGSDQSNHSWRATTHSRYWGKPRNSSLNFDSGANERIEKYLELALIVAIGMGLL